MLPHQNNNHNPTQIYQNQKNKQLFPYSRSARPFKHGINFQSEDPSYQEIFS